MTRLSITRIREAVHHIDPVFLNTPQFVSDALSRLLGATVVLKVETANPIRCFKGRGAEWLVAESKEDTIVCASAGNFGQAIAYSCRKVNKKSIVFASLHANPVKVERMRELGAEVMLEGKDFDEAKDNARRFAATHQLRFVEDSLDVQTVEGAGTIGLELMAMKQHLDAVIIPLGNGAMVNGIATALRSLSPTTKIIAVQALGAPAMVESWKQKKLISHESVATIADGVAVRLPVQQALADMENVVDDAWLVKEDSILQAMKVIHEHAGLVTEPSGALGVAALTENKLSLQGKCVATILCGSNVLPEQFLRWIA